MANEADRKAGELELLTMPEVAAELRVTVEDLPKLPGLRERVYDLSGKRAAKGSRMDSWRLRRSELAGWLDELKAAGRAA